LPPYVSVNVPAFMGAGDVSVNMLDVAVFSPKRARPVPDAEIAVVQPEIKTARLETHLANHKQALEIQG
jgi:hypothetical protein